MFLSLAGAVPWKRTGLSGHVSRSDYKYPTDGCVHGPKSRSCWGDGFDISTDMDLKWPNTGKTVKYDFEITNVTLAPDGFEKPMMVVNGQYPGPTIVADWGDDIEVVVKNSLTINGTGIHWHGMRQLGSNEMDGVGGVTECPIAPGETKIYRFKATQYGSSWWHSHYSIQYGEGIVGGLIINGPSTKNYDIDLGILPFTDWFHAPLFTVNAAALRATGPPISDNLLVNGSMTSASGGQYAVTTLTPGKTHLLRLTNTGINNYVHVGLDGHKFTVIAADLTPIVPYETSSVVLAVGQRYDVLISANQTVGNYWLRVGTGGRCDGPNANAANIASIFRYDGASDSLPTSNATTPLPTGCYDETNLVPFIDTQIPQEVPDNLTVGFTNTAAESNLVQWTINGSPMLIDFTRPTIQQVIDGNTSYNQAENVFAIGEAHQFQYWVIQQSNTTPPLPHPIHLHGHDFFILESGSTPWTGDISRLKVDNPVRRDTATLPAGGYLVLAFESDNPGAWLMHCHIPFHVSAGFGLQFVERQDEILSKSVGDLQGFRDGCKSWATFQTEFWPDGFEQGDSGL
ncbi:multicopper oxidase-domain-containing protein [Massariosphaeria phaeospora]|uniref:Multicopper oxidase-domain-containing protein n=1 Tax=Massariosphaeria phaeospora TaxID=100035 RepID=A0A7C8MBG0_9PLEO|nr:multicopper oxidase-domain-containing protein [Massariosphaeria phaeospora]